MQTHTVVKGYIEWLYDNMFSARALKKKQHFIMLIFHYFFIYACTTLECITNSPRH